MIERLRRVRRRLFWRGFLAGLMLCAGGGLVLWALWLSAVRMGLVERASLGWPAWAVAAVLALLASAWMARRRTPGLGGVARMAERRLGLDERLSTALELGDRSDALALALREDTEAKAADLVRPRELAPLRPGPAQAWSLAAGAAALAVALVAPLPSARELSVERVPEGARGVVAGDTFIRQLLDDPASILSTAAGGASSAAEPRQPTGRGGSSAGGAQEVGASTSTPIGALSAESVPATDARRPAAAGGSPEASQPAGAARADAPSELPLPPPLGGRNDGGTNPGYPQASTRDQELREYARRQEAAAGAGGGEPVAMVDAAVAGDATAGYGGSEATPPPRAAGATDDLAIESVTDPSGRRVRVERLPDELTPPAAGAAQEAAAWSPVEEPLVTREATPVADMELLRRYHGAANAP